MVRELSEEKRQRFLRTALKLFVANGIQNTSTAEIAKAAGTAAGTLFLYFATKQDLIDELVLLIAREEAECVNRQLNPSQPAREMLFTIWSASLHWLLENPDAFQYSQQIRNSGAVSEAVARETGQYFRFYYEAIQKGLAEGCLKPLPVDLIGSYLYQDIVAVMEYMRFQSDPGQREEAIQQGFELFWDGIRIR